MFLQCYIVFCAGTLFVSAQSGDVVRSVTASKPGVVDEILGLDEFINRHYNNPEEVDAWLAGLHSKEENITSQYRPNMTEHREGILEMKKDDPKWIKCVTSYQKELEDFQTLYLNMEQQCLEAANKSYTEKLELILMLDRKILQWRENYNNLTDLCNKTYPDDQDTVSRCLTESLKRDKSGKLLERLYIQKLDAVVMMPYHEVKRTIEDLEKCLSSSCTVFWDQDQRLICTLTACYNA